MSPLDDDLVWDSLSPSEREIFARIADELGLEDWTEVPPLRGLLPVLANHRAAAVTLSKA